MIPVEGIHPRQAFFAHGIDRVAGLCLEQYAVLDHVVLDTVRHGMRFEYVFQSFVPAVTACAFLCLADKVHVARRMGRTSNHTADAMVGTALIAYYAASGGLVDRDRRP